MEEKSNLFQEVLDDFSAMWESRYGMRYYPTAKDKSQLGRLLQKIPREELPDLNRAFENYLEDLTSFVTEKVRHSLAFFCSDGFNKYRVTPVVMSDREALSAMAVNRFVKGRRQ